MELWYAVGASNSYGGSSSDGGAALSSGTSPKSELEPSEHGIADDDDDDGSETYLAEDIEQGNYNCCN